VDLVLQAHNHNYQRSCPISCNSQKSLSPLIKDNRNSAYSHPKGAIFVIAGRNDWSIYSLTGKSPFIVNQPEGCGILDVKITNGGSKLTGIFYSNEGNEIVDTFSMIN
jgi:hypothetical protein